MTAASLHPLLADLLSSAQACRRASDLDGAKARAEQAMSLAESLDDRQALSRAAALLARILHDRIESAEGLACALRAIELSVAADDPRSEALAHETAARILLSVGDPDAALPQAMAALRVADASQDPLALMAAMAALTNVYAQLQQWHKALEFGERYCESARQVGDKATESAAIDTVSYIYGCMAQEAAEQGDAALAMGYEHRTVELSGTALQMAREIDNRLGEATCLGNLAESLSNVGRHQEALALLDSWVADPARDSASIVAHHRETRGIVLVGLGRHGEAAELLRRSVAEAPSLPQEITACRALALLLETLGDLRGALDYQKRLFTLVSKQSSQAARRAASVAAVQLQTAQAEDRADRLQARASDLMSSNERINRRSADLQRQAFEDALTGLPNRRRLEQLLTADAPGLSIVMVDVDHFKEVNDHHSHLVGDAVLCDLARLLRASCRDEDTALRFGGEEFTLLMRDSSLEGLYAAAERARASIQAHPWPSLAPGLAVTASFGIAHSSEASTGLELLALADTRLYAAKQGGRNRVVGPA